MKSHRPQNRSRSFVLVLALGLIATGHAGIAQPPEAPSEPPLELALVTSEWLKPDLILVSFELRNNGREPVVVGQRPGVSLGVSCPIGDGVAGIIGGSVGPMVACGPDPSEHGTFLELRPGAALLGEKVVRVPKGCTGDVTVMGQFDALSAKGWDLPAHGTVISSSPINVGSPGDPEADSPEDDDADSPP